MMEFPVRCFTCGSVIGHLYADYKKISAEKSAEVALDELGVDRYCCRRMFLSHVDIVDTIMKYPRA
jgi:DNA-directed RNA polymerase subunit N